MVRLSQLALGWLVAVLGALAVQAQVTCQTVAQPDFTVLPPVLPGCVLFLFPQLSAVFGPFFMFSRIAL